MPGKAWRQHLGGGVGHQHVEAPAGHDRRHRELIDQLLCAVGHHLDSRIILSGRGWAGDLVQILGRLDVQSQRPRQRVEYLSRRVLVTALLEPQVVLSADPGEQC